MMNGRNLSEILDKLPDVVFWPIIEEIESRPLEIEDAEFRKNMEELDSLISSLDASAKIIAEDNE